MVVDSDGRGSIAIPVTNDRFPRTTTTKHCCIVRLRRGIAIAQVEPCKSWIVDADGRTKVAIPVASIPNTAE